MYSGCKWLSSGFRTPSMSTEESFAVAQLVEIGFRQVLGQPWTHLVARPYGLSYVQQVAFATWV